MKRLLIFILTLIILLPAEIPVSAFVSPPSEVDSSSGNGSGTNIDVTLPSNNNSQLIVVTFHLAHDAEQPVISTPTGWTALTPRSGTSQFIQVFHRVGNGNTSVTFPTSISVVRYTWRVATYSGVDLANPIVASNGSSSSLVTFHSAPSVSTAIANCLIVYTFGSGQRDTEFTLSSAITQRFSQSGSVDENVSPMLIADKVFSGTGSSGTANASTTVICFDVGFTIAIAPAPALRRKRKAVIM